MKHNQFSISKFLIALFLSISFLNATTLTYSPAVPQTGDQEVIISHKAAVAATTTATNSATIATQTTTAATKLTTLLAGNSYTHITTATTTVIKAAPGVLERIVVNTVGAGSAATIYDNATGTTTVIGVATTAIQTSLTYNINCSAGITIVTAGGTPADITVVWR